MRLFAVSDLHLSTVRPKPMDVFGPGWKDHPAPLFAAWRETVRDDDIVLVAGDISWAMKLDEAKPDLDAIAALPGTKVFIKGNHDYWWSAIGQVRRAAGPRMHFIQNNALGLSGVALTGTRLWDFSGIAWPSGAAANDEEATPTPSCVGRGAHQDVDPEVIRKREIERLRAGLGKLPADAALRVALLHYPPLGADGEPTEITAILNEFRVDLCVFGHRHGLVGLPPPGADRTIHGTRCVLTSCDCIGFRPLLL